MNKLFTSALLAMLAPASFIFSQSNYTFSVNTWQAIQNQQATVVHTQTDIGSTGDIFDGNFNTLARSANVNPFVVTLVFDYTINVSSMSTMQNNGYGWWTVEAANSVADLDNHTGSYQVLFSQSPLAQDVIATLPVSVSKKAFRLTMQKTIGDDYVHLWEWGIVATATVQITDLCFQPNQVRLIKNASFPVTLAGVDNLGNTYPLTTGATWLSSNPGIASVNSSGLMNSFSSLGETVLTGSWSGLSKSTHVKVVDDFTMPLAPQRTVKVALVIIDPPIPAAGGQRFSQVPWTEHYGAPLTWEQLSDGSPLQLAQKVRDSLTAVSGGVAKYEFVEIHDDNELHNTFGQVNLSIDSAYHLFKEAGWDTWHLVAEQQGQSVFRYNELLDKYNFCEKSNNHQIDEIWVYAMPFIGMWEANMTGTGAFWINGPVLSGNSCTDLLPIMGFNYERTYDLALHNFGHRIETTMYKTFGTSVRYVNADPPYPPGVEKNTLQKFMSYDQTEPGDAHVGNVHFPPNGIENYGYYNTGSVTSYEQNWKRYPFLFQQTRSFNCTDWDCSHDGFMRWWLRRIPKFKCKDKDGFLNNWWAYVIDYNEGKAMEAQVSNCDCEIFSDSPPPPANYCQSYSNFPWEDWIAKVKLGTIDNASGKSPYSDFTNISTTLQKGVPTPIELTTGFSYFTFNEHWRVWIDFNHDGVFSTPDELVQQQILTAPANGTPTATIIGSVNVPQGALTGPTRMRVSMKRGAYPAACETLPFGEVEDYTVNITSGPVQLPNLSINSYEVIPYGGGGFCFTNPGQNFQVFIGLALNDGTAPAGPFSIKGWFSKDQQLSADDVLWNSFQYTGVEANNVVYWSFTNPVPASLTPGLYYVILKVDADNTVAESDETDNIRTIQVWIGAPDFTVSNVTGLPASLPPGSSLYLAIQTTNLSAFPLAEISGSLTAKIYLSTNNQFSTLDDVEIGTGTLAFNQFSNGPLFNPGIATANLAAQIPAGTAAGNYFIFVVVSSQCEVSAANNVSSPVPVQVTTGPQGTYCTSTSNFPWEDWIAKVKIGTINNASGKSPYSDFTNISTTLQKGVPTPIELTTGFSYFTFNEHWRVWIDFNHDGVFSTPDELVQQQILTAPANGTATATITGSVNVPQGALTGPTRMRVSMKRGAYPSACETLPFGEVEDYTVNITASSGCSPDVTPPVITGCPGNISVTSAVPAAVNWTPPTATDNCTTPTLTSSHQPGAVFPFGTTTVTYTAKDAANNMATCTFTVTVTQVVTNLPDLVLTNLQAPASGTAGSVVNFTFKLDNIGASPAAGNFTIGCYLSTDNVWSANDVLAGTVPTGNIPVNFNSTVQAAITVPAGLASGNYFLICFADNGNVIQESNENNNTVSAAFQVTGGGPVAYCNAYSNFPWEDWIAGVKIGTQENNSGKSTYSDFTQTFNFNLFENNQVTLTAGFSYFHYDEYWRIWIDLNGDGDFDDPGELVFSQVMNKGVDGTPTQTLTGNFNLPASAVAGTTRMRVMMKRGAFGEPCDVIPFGEIEDYSVNISGLATCRQDVGPGGLACFEEAPTPGQYYLYAYNQGMQVRYTVNKDGDLLDQLSSPLVLEDSIIVQNNTVVRKLANGNIVYQKPIGASVLNQFPNIEAAVELDDGSFVLSGFQRYYNGNIITDDSLVMIKTNASLDFLSYLTVYRHPGFPYIPASNKLYGLAKTQTGDVVAIYSQAVSYGLGVNSSIIFSKYSPQLQFVASFSLTGHSLLMSRRLPCGNYSVSYAYSYQSIKSGLVGTATSSIDLENMTVQTSRSSETGSVAYSGNYDSESYASRLFGDTLSASYSIWYGQQTINPFTVTLKRPDGSTFQKRPPMQADYRHIIQTGDTTILVLGSTGGQVWAYNPDCNSPGAVQPDITMANLTIQNPNTSPGAVVWFNFDLKNIGNTTATGDYIIAAYLSSDNVLSNDDRVAGYINTGNTPVGTIPGVLGGITVPAEQGTGSYYLILQADVSNAILELDETNNVLVASTPIVIAPGSPEICGFEATVATEGFSTFSAASLNGSHVYKMSKYDAGADLTTFRYQTLDNNGNTTSTEDFTLDDLPVLLADDNFLRVVNGGGNLFFLKKINRAGTVLWVKQLTVPGATNLGDVSIGEAVNGDILLTGVYSIPSTITQYRVWYIRLDYNGNILSQNNIVYWENNELSARIFQGYNKGTYIIVEKPSSFAPWKQPLLIKISPLTGNVEWTKDFGLFVQIRGIAETPDGAALVTTFYPNPTGGGVGTHATLHKINPDGNEVFQKSLTELAPDIPPSAQIGPPSEVSPIMRSTDGGYITGFTRILLGSVSLPSQSVIIRLDGNLDTLWTRVLTSPDDGLFRTFRTVPGGAFLGTRLFGSGQVKLVKIGADGNMAPCAAPGTYCQSQSDFPWHEWIARVQLNTLDNASGKSTYSDFTALSTTLQQGSDYALTLTTGFSYFTWDEHWKVWIDYNHDGIFQEPDELVLYQVLTAPPAGTATASVTGTFKLPNTALTGPTRMRVSMKRGGAPSPCEMLPFGEVEDYTVNIVNSLTSGTDDRASNLGFEAVREKTWVHLYGAFHFPEAVSSIEVEKSTDGHHFELLADFEGKQEAGARQVVRTTDRQPEDGLNFYRMLIWLENGELVVSPVRTVVFDMPLDFTLFPNPASSEIFIHLADPPDEAMLWYINDAYGRVLWTQKIQPGEAFPYRLDVSQFAPGMYHLLAMPPGRRAVGRRFVVVR